MDIILTITSIVFLCLAMLYRVKWLKSDKLSKRRLRAYEECRNNYDRLLHDNQALDVDFTKAKVEVELLKSKLKEATDLKSIVEQNWESERKLRMEAELKLIKSNPNTTGVNS